MSKRNHGLRCHSAYAVAAVLAERVRRDPGEGVVAPTLPQLTP
jgi:hypothetical protein